MPTRLRPLPSSLLLLVAMGCLPAVAAGDGASLMRARQLPEDVPAAWEQTRRYLEQRVLEAPADARARLALAQHHTTRASTVRTGIVQLAQLAQPGNDPEVAQAALESWRDALGWAGGDRSDVPFYQAFLRLSPRDAAVRERLDAITRSGVNAARVRTAPPAALDGLPSPVSRAALAPAPVFERARPADDLELAYPATATPTVVPTATATTALTPAPAPAPATTTIQEARQAPAGIAMPPQVAQAVAMPPLDDTQVKLRALQSEIAAIERDRVPVLSVGSVVRSRQGERGLSRMLDAELPLQLKFDLGDSKMTIGVTPVALRAGTSATDAGTLGRFGGGPALAAALPGASPGAQNQNGLGLGVGYESGNFQADVGTTPLGFVFNDVTGGAKYRVPVNEEFSFSMNVSRRPVTDSVLSFAGARDDRTGARWGGVSATGGRLDANWDGGGFGAYGYGAYHRLTGHDVQTNTRTEAGTGVYVRLKRTDDATLTAGLALTALAFDKNLGFFTYGQGGYFSPQQFVSLAVPVEWRQRTGRLAYQIGGSLGVQHVRSDPSPYFPLNAQLQANAPFYEGQKKTGPGYNFAAALEYQVDPQWFVGGRLGIDNARDYRQFSGSLYLRYAFRAYDGPQALPLNPVRSPYGS